ncbi:hypothetical protein [Natronoglomus mannanivorans]|uniref:DUF8152 domain-containing protein n=1 Tax=Natronoglomus mannanivorans TaxID=2979990 RepID=A0AAP3E1Q0_9EURY|nr:hypothetical protein [Halobacteria archaeon AArc-xg1-1]
MTDDALDARTHDLHAHLEATAELPIDRETNRWLGEAEAVARDAATSDLTAPVVKERVQHVEDLLSEVEDTGHEAGNEHLEAARSICRTILNG